MNHTGIKVVLLAVLQGVTEVLPVSSSGHLVLAKYFLRLQTHGAALEIALHTGTLISIMVYYRRKLFQLAADVFLAKPEARRYVGFLFLGCLPAGIVGVFFNRQIEDTFSSPIAVAWLLLGTGLIVLSLRWVSGKQRELTAWRAVLIGLAQAVAILPGISRSGTTVVSARQLGIKPDVAAEFSFLMAIPLMLGAILLEGHKVSRADFGAATPTQVILGTAVAAIVGYGALAALSRLLRSGVLWWFGPYCLLAGALSLILL